MGMEVTQPEVDGLVRSLLNYYLLVRCGVLTDNSVSDGFLHAIQEIERQGPNIFNEDLRDP